MVIVQTVNTLIVKALAGLLGGHSSRKETRTYSALLLL